MRYGEPMRLRTLLLSIAVVASALAACSRQTKSAPSSTTSALDAGPGCQLNRGRDARAERGSGHWDRGSAGRRPSRCPRFRHQGQSSPSASPTNLETCLPDPAEHAGFTRDGLELGYCVRGMYLRCEFVDEAGRKRELAAMRNASDNRPGGDEKKARGNRAINADAGLPALARRDCKLRPPAIRGTWAYPDITIHVITEEAIFRKTAQKDREALVSQPRVRIGGALRDEKPVFRITVSAPHRKISPPEPAEIPYNLTEVNALALSPEQYDADHHHPDCMKWCNNFEIDPDARVELRLARVQRRGLPRAQGGQLRACGRPVRSRRVRRRGARSARLQPGVRVDRLGDERAKDALALAIERGGARR